MAYEITSSAALRPGILARLGDGLFDALVRIAERSSLAARARLAARLHEKSDAELAELGIDRDRIAHFAFGGYAML
ncbi:hypothetical protein [Amaricoccus solimangrovi]|uniref:DUF1127 domain-containing protein n=1 Tax=Amaricoccus solimangrovi TaxID=2589815 RepID=A0A501WUL2_9RHOB|nr:hypothetical protein [Amaricoccus solimangrovi]TPE53108.1 hypothetical protein FJM51_03540 [Amaricoccus solimangrovi]